MGLAEARLHVLGAEVAWGFVAGEFAEYELADGHKHGHRFGGVPCI